MLQLKKLTSSAEFERFAASFVQNDGTPVPISYLKQATVYATYRPDCADCWMGGFVLSTQHKRYLEVLPAEKRQHIEATQIPSDNSVEISCIWKNRAMKMALTEVARLYYLALREGYRTGKRFILAGTANPKIKPIQMTVFHRMLFDGTVDFYGNPHQVWVYYCKRNEVFTGFLRYLNAYLW